MIRRAQLARSATHPLAGCRVANRRHDINHRAESLAELDGNSYRGTTITNSQRAAGSLTPENLPTTNVTTSTNRLVWLELSYQTK